jgi:hypothetical protein
VRDGAAHNPIKRITSVHRQCGDYIPFSCLWFDQSVCADGEPPVRAALIGVGAVTKALD